MNNFVKVCPNCKSPNIKQQIPQVPTSWMCMTCGNRSFFPIEIMDKEMK